VVICASPGTAPGELAALVARARAGGAVFAAVAAGDSAPDAAVAEGTGADAVISAGTDVLAFGEKLLTSLEGAR
jgi:methylmalonyl-CoA mutase cobalamin-binding subunit